MPQQLDGVRLETGSTNNPKGQFAYMVNTNPYEVWVKFYHFRLGERKRGLSWRLHPNEDLVPCGSIYTPGSSPEWHAYSLYRVSNAAFEADAEFEDAQRIQQPQPEQDMRTSDLTKSVATKYARHDLCELRGNQLHLNFAFDFATACSGSGASGSIYEESIDYARNAGDCDPTGTGPLIVWQIDHS